MRLISWLLNYMMSTWYNAMIYTTLFCSLVGLVVSDNRIIPRHQGKGVHPDYAMCAETFEQLTGQKVTTPIQPATVNIFGIGTRAIGVTYFSSWYNTEIEIDIDAWNKRSENPLQQCTIVWHEIAHAQCEADHNDSVLPDGCSASIMAPIEGDPKCLKKHSYEIMQSLVDVCKEQ